MIKVRTVFSIFPVKDKINPLLVFGFCCLLGSLSAQNLTETLWYFGNSPSNLVFDANGREAIAEENQMTPFGIGGSAVIVDQFTGNLLFYTDGVQIFDATHNPLPASAGLNGLTTLNVPVVTAPVTGQPGRYYLFTNTRSTIERTVVDATLVGNGTTTFPLGDVVSKNIDMSFSDPAEGMLIVPAGDGRKFYFLHQNRTTFDINVTLLNASGIGVTSTFNFANNTRPGFEIAHMAFNVDSSFLALAPKTQNRNIWILNFDITNGNLSFNRSILNSGFADNKEESLYDIEWSSNGSKLYFSRYGGGTKVAQVYQVDFNDPTQSIHPILSEDIYRSYGLKRAIDNNIYHLYQDNMNSPFHIGIIMRADSIADSVIYEQNIFESDFMGHQFPMFTAGYDFVYNTLDFYFIDSCLNNTTRFFPIVDPVPNRLSWNFGGEDDNSDDWIPSFTFMQEGSYTVSMTAEVNGISKTYMTTVNILTNDLEVNLGNDTTICVDEVLTLDAGSGQSFVWNTGELTQTINIDTAGIYWVEVTNTAGCTDYDEIEVTEYGIAKQTSNHWYFGERAGIDFNNGPIALLDANNMYSEEGVATVSDINGELLFYTNGSTIWNREHEVMENGYRIGGDSVSAQNSMILPYSGDRTLYYVFTNEQVYGDGEYTLKYSIVDMKEANGLGKVIIKDIKLMQNSTERITAAGFAGNDFLVTHEFGSNVFRTFQTGEDGLSGPIFSPIGEVHSLTNEQSATGYMKLSESLSILAVNIPGTNQIEILDFDDGILSNPRLINTNEDNLYGLEISNEETKLYVTTTGTNSKLIQYDLDSLKAINAAKDIEATKFDGYTGGMGYGALQTGPDGVIYMAIDNSTTIGTIPSPNQDDTQAGFNSSGFDLQGRKSRLGYPILHKLKAPHHSRRA